jgi:hypothetical protein
MMEFFRKYPRSVDGLRGPIFEDKVIDFVVELAKVTDETVTPDALAQEPPMPETGHAASAAAAPSEDAAGAGAPAADAAPAPESERPDVPPDAGG